VARSASSAEPDYDLKYLHEFFIEPFQYVTHGDRNDNPGAATVVVDESGDNLAQILMLRPNGDQRRHSFAELSAYPNGPMGNVLDIPNDLMNLKLRSLVVTDPDLRKAIADLSGMRPVQYFAMPLGDRERGSPFAKS